MQQQSGVGPQLDIFILHHGFMFNFMAFYIVYGPINLYICVYLYKFDPARCRGLGPLISCMFKSFHLLKTRFTPAKVHRGKCCSSSQPKTWSNSRPMRTPQYVLVVGEA